MPGTATVEPITRKVVREAVVRARVCLVGSLSQGWAVGQPDAAFLSDHVWPGHASGSAVLGALLFVLRTASAPLLCSLAGAWVLSPWHLLQSWDGAVEKEPGLRVRAGVGGVGSCRGPGLRACGGEGRWWCGAAQCSCACRGQQRLMPEAVCHRGLALGWSLALKGRSWLLSGPSGAG